MNPEDIVLQAGADALLVELRARGYPTGPPEIADGEWHELKISVSGDGREAIFVDGWFVEGDKTYAKQVRPVRQLLLDSARDDDHD